MHALTIICYVKKNERTELQREKEYFFQQQQQKKKPAETQFVVRLHSTDCISIQNVIYSMHIDASRCCDDDDKTIYEQKKARNENSYMLDAPVLLTKRVHF